MKRKRKEAKRLRIRRAATLVVSLEGGKLVLHNFLTRDRFSCPAEYLDFLAKLDDWQEVEKLFTYFPDTDRTSLARELAKMIETKILLVEGSRESELDETYRREWNWGATAGFFHFSVRNTRFVVGAAARKLMRKRKAWKRSPKVVGTNTGSHVINLPATDLAQEPFALMRRRRSRRRFDQTPVTLQVLADCLYAGNGIVGFTDDQDFGRLPLAMTPSGGARNPFELYVYAQHITGLKPGFYHYDALKHNLGLVRAGKVQVPPMLGTQKWPAKTAAIIFLVAYFPRSSWKYHMPMAYRIVVMEAGFIGQNIALAATHHGLSAIPSGALNDSLIEGYLGLPTVESAALLTMNIGRPIAQGD